MELHKLLLMGKTAQGNFLLKYKKNKIDIVVYNKDLILC